jgi:hypothetical protein
MNDTALVQKVWNFAHVLRDRGVPYQADISQISYLLFLKMDEERSALIASGWLKARRERQPHRRDRRMKDAMRAPLVNEHNKNICMGSA